MKAHSIFCIYLDTCCINAKGKEVSLNKLEQLAKENPDTVLIEKTDVMDSEFLNNKGYQAGLRKSRHYIESFGSGVWDQSRWDKSVWGDREDWENHDKILTILRSYKNKNSWNDNDVADAMHLTTAVKYGGTHFVTSDVTILKASKRIEILFGIQITKPNDVVSEIERRLEELEDI